MSISRMFERLIIPRPSRDFASKCLQLSLIEIYEA